MFYTVSLCLFVLFSLIGIMAVCYVILLLFMRPKRKHKSVMLLPMSDNDPENAGRIGYAVERLSLFGEDKNVEVWALEPEGSELTAVRQMFEKYNSVKFAHIGDMPYMMKNIFDEN